MADEPIESLEVQVETSAKQAISGIEALQTSLVKLKGATKGGLGLKSVATNLQAISAASHNIDGETAANLGGLAKAIDVLSRFKDVKISSSIAKQLDRVALAIGKTQGMSAAPLAQIASGINSLAAVDPSNLAPMTRQLKKIPDLMDSLGKGNFTSACENLQELTNTLLPLSEIQKGGFGSILNSLKKMPEVMGEISKLTKGDMEKFKNQIQEIAIALKPLATEMQMVANGFSAFPAKLQKVLGMTKRIPSANRRAGSSYLGLIGKMGALYLIFRRSARAIAGWINESNEYIENLNLFNVSMGEYAGEARRYAEQVGEIMGIDPGEWMRNQGIFQTLATGFGVAADRAYIMSKNLTQLGYDLSSFFNISTQDSFQKLQSGLAGELEPLRRLGFDLSKARLEQEALNLGIQKNYNAMTQAEKAQLRYVAILSQVTTAQGDMARTLNAPANQLRILRAQVTMAARSIGNIFIPILNAILPYAIAAAKAIRFLADTIASLFGFKLPQVSYDSVKAIGGAGAGAENLGNKLGGAAKKAKELHTQMMGIDELNVLQQPNEDLGGGAGGGGVGDIGGGGGFDFDLPQYDFLGDAVNTKVDRIFKKFKKTLEDIFKFIKDNQLEILTLTAAIGAGLLAWKLSSAFVSAVNKLSRMGGLLSVLKGMSKQIGLTMAFAGFTMEFGGAYGLGKNGFNLKDAILTAIGSALGLTGSVMFLGSNPAGWIVGITATLAVAIGGIALGRRHAKEEKFWESGAGNALKEVEDMLSQSHQVNLDLKARINSITGEVDASTMADFTMAQELINDIFAIYDGSGGSPTAQELELIHQKIQILDGLNLDGIQGIFQSFIQDGIMPTKDAIQGVMDKLLEQYQLQAMQDAYVEAFRAQYDAQKQVEAATEGVRAAQDAYNAVMKETGMDEYQSALKSLVDYLKSTGHEVDETTGKSELWSKVMQEDSAQAYALWDNLAKATQQTAGLGDETERAKEALENANAELQDAQDKYALAGDLVNDLEWDLQNLISTTDTAAYAGSAAGEAYVDGFRRALQDMPTEVPMPSPGGGGSSRPGHGQRPGDNTLPEIMAGGGFPRTGQMFVAREAGPEYVGNIGSRTAVANNAQITQGVASGVEEANQGVIAAIYNLISVVEEKDLSVNIGDEEIGEANDRYRDSRGAYITTGSYA